MSEKLTWDEIKKKYDGEWVELVDFDWDETEADPQSGVVRVHSKDKKEFHQLILDRPDCEAAIVYVGDVFPEQSNHIFSANLHQYASSRK
jgi:hypothetical protein